MKNKPAIGPLFTDLYELTMAAGYHEHQVSSEATFSLFIRNHRPLRNYFVAAGLEEALDELENYRFAEGDIEYLSKTGLFPDAFLSYLAQLRFSGDICAMPEGTIFFGNEPVLEVTAPIIEAQMVETFLLNTMGLQSMIASKAARCIHAAQGRPLIDFSLRRTQGQDAGNKVARSTYIAGFVATSNVLAGKLYDIPISGTMAHSFISAFETEIEAFSAFADTYPEHSVFLIDTYDTIEGARNAVKVAIEMGKKGKSLIGVRLDSGDMADLSKKVRKILDDAGLYDVKIFASSGFDEYKIAEVISKGAMIDAFGVGTKLGVSADAPYLDVVYKIVRFNGRDVRKLSPGKITLAGKKQVFRKFDSKGMYQEDIIGMRDEVLKDAKPLMGNVMKNGKRTRPSPSLQEIQDKFKENFAALGEKYKSFEADVVYPVRLSSSLSKIQGGA